MGLTYRKNLGRPLTSDEIDANFEFFTSSLGGATTGSNTFVGNQTITGSILISGSIIPAVGVGQTTSSFSLGSPTAAWKDIYVSEGSIKFIKSGSEEVVLSAKDGGISIDGGSIISADGVSGQFITSKSLDTSVTVKDSNNSLLMGPIEVETDKEIVVEEGSDLTIFGDIDIQNVATADTASYAITASYVLNSNPTFPYSGSAVITGSLFVNNGLAEVLTINPNTGVYKLSDYTGTQTIDFNSRLLRDTDGSSVSINWGNRLLTDTNGDTTSVDWENRKLQDSSDVKSVDWASRLLTDSTNTTSIDWENRTLASSTGNTVIDYSDSASLFLNTTTGLYGFTSASSNIIDSTPTGQGNVQIAFAQSGSNFYIYAYIGGQWRSASLS